jgi:hypothetical protein
MLSQPKAESLNPNLKIVFFTIAYYGQESIIFAAQMKSIGR